MATKETITQLNSARDIVLRDPAIYPQVVPGVLPVIGSAQPVELRRWGADFLAETFASPVLNAEEKGKLCLAVLDTLKAYLTRKDQLGEEEDTAVLKAAIQCCASVYPLLFRHVIVEGDKEAWDKMMALKSSILKRMDTAGVGVRICCIKFVARVVQVQTPGLIADPRKPDQNEVSLALVPREHGVLVPSNLEAEASGLLDRLLSVFQDNSSEAIIVTSTLNALSTLVQRRASISTKILSVIINFMPVKRASTGAEKIAVKSTTRTTITFLNNVVKRSPQHSLVARAQAHTERLRQTLQESFLDQPNGLKRGPDEPIDGFHPNKRLQLDPQSDSATTQQQQKMHGGLPSGPVSYKDLYTLPGTDRIAAGFHVESLPAQIVAQLIPPLLSNMDDQRFHQALNMVRARVLEIQRRPPVTAVDASRGTFSGHLDVEEDDDYDPNALGFGFEEQEQMDPKMAGIIPQPPQAEQAMRLPPEPPLSEEERQEFGEMVRGRLFDSLKTIDDEVAKRKAEKRVMPELEKTNGFNRSVVDAVGGQDREAWLTLLLRIATRTILPEDEEESGEERIKEEEEEGEDLSLVKQGKNADLPSRIRKALNRYIMDDWRRRIDVAIAWLNEEWYADRLASKSTKCTNYRPWVLSLLDQMIPYLDTKDGRYLIRFLSEIPIIPNEVFERVRKIAEDPERVALSTQALLYLIMLKPPAREQAIDCAVQMWRTNADAKASVQKILTKWRPEVLNEGAKEVKEEIQEV